MNIKREWVTPFTVGAFLLCAVTGILIFFHIDSGLNRFAHEWSSWALVCGVVLHVIINFEAFEKYLFSRLGLLIVGIFIVLLSASFVSMGKKNDRPSFILPIQALSQTSLTTLAQVAQISPEELLARLSKAGIQPTSDQHKLSDIVGNNPRRQMHILNAVLSESR